MENGLAIHMLTEKKYPLSQEMISKMLKKKLEVDHESSQAIELLSTNGVSTASTNLVLPVLINTASRKELVLLMVKAAELKIRMHGDYYGMMMLPRMTTQSAVRATATPRGGRTGGRTGRGGGRTEGRSDDQGNGRVDGQGNQGRGQGNGRNQNGDAINDNIWGDVRNVIENNDHRGYTYKECLVCNPKEYDGKGGAICGN
ncbi:hypothetical protein Tco_0822384 [Tanacetum coccineum]|uniref:Uncharacterized protein n=1 Tax=Tanacetum coccineum TaxID=301880 RepID=A0ABQ5AF08_9ASTR